jgi:hypothetical protein
MIGGGLFDLVDSYPDLNGDDIRQAIEFLRKRQCANWEQNGISHQRAGDNLWLKNSPGFNAGAFSQPFVMIAVRLASIAEPPDKAGVIRVDVPK